MSRASDAAKRYLALQIAAERIMDLWQTACIKPGRNDPSGFELGAAMQALRNALWGEAPP